MLHRTTHTLIRHPRVALRRLLARSVGTRAPDGVGRAALFFRWTAVGLYTTACVISGWVVLRALVG